MSAAFRTVVASVVAHVYGLPHDRGTRAGGCRRLCDAQRPNVRPRQPASALLVWLCHRRRRRARRRDDSVDQRGVAGPIPRYAEAVLNSNEPALVTAALVTGAVLAFAVLGYASATPVRTFRRLALIVLVLSFMPNVAMAVSGAGWLPMGALMAMHVAPWATTVLMLTRLGVED
jgi:hypothetical protein